jgi:hypothetical protein
MVADEIGDWATNLATTLPDEQVFKVLRDAEKSSPNGKLGRAARWACADECGVLPDMEIPYIEPSAEDRSAANGIVITSSMFHVDGEDNTEFSEGYERFKEVLREHVEFPTIEPQNWNMSAFKWRCLRSSAHVRTELGCAWMSLLAPTGALLVDMKAKKVLGIVVRSTQWGVATMTLDVERLAKGGRREKLLTLRPSAWETLVITNLDECDVQMLEPVPPYKRAQIYQDLRGCLPEQHALTWRLTGPRLSLMQASAIKCFHGLTTNRLNSWVTECKVPYEGRRATNEKALCDMLLRWCWPSWAEDKIQETLR